MVRKIELIYSPCQVSNRFKKTGQKVDGKISLRSYGETAEILAEVEFRCRAFQTDVPFNETFKSVLRAVSLDHVPPPRANVKLAMKNCPVECIETVTMEIIHWRNTLRRSGYSPERLHRSFHLKAPEKSTKKLNSHQLYQTSIVNFRRHQTSELLPYTREMLSIQDGSQLMSETQSSNSSSYLWNRVAKLDFCCHHKKSALDLSLLQRNTCLVSFLTIASFGEFMHPTPRLDRFETFQIELDFCQICIPVVIAALRFLLNTLSHFHVFLPIGHAFRVRALYSLNDTYDVHWYSTWPVGCLYIPGDLFYPIADHHPKLHLYVDSTSNPPRHDPPYPDISHDWYTKLESQLYLLPKSLS